MAQWEKPKSFPLGGKGRSALKPFLNAAPVFGTEEPKRFIEPLFPPQRAVHPRRGACGKSARAGFGAAWIARLGGGG
jgi:hypothetical protein